MKMLKIFAAIVGLVCLVLGFLVFSKMSANARAQAELQEQFAQLQQAASTEFGVPGKAVLETLQERVGKLQQLYAATMEGVSVKYETKPVLTPLEFKEELLKTQSESAKTAAKKGVELGGEIGFSEYMGGKIPKSDEMPVLSQQLYLVRDLLSFCVESNVKRVNRISLPEPAAGDKDQAPAAGIFRTIEAEIDITTSFSSFIQLLDMLYHRPEIMWVNSLSLKRDQRTDAGLMLSAVLTVEVIVHREPVAEKEKQKK